jgi:hypothetical protein
LGRTTARASSLLDELRAVTRRSLSRRVHRHYRGFALNQLRFLEKEPTAKKLLYVLRTTTTGIHLLRTRELETDLTRLTSAYELEGAEALIERKRAGERVAVEHDSFPVTGWSTGPREDWYVYPLVSYPPSAAVTVRLTTAMQQTLDGVVYSSINNGAGAMLSVTVAPDAPSGTWSVVRLVSRWADLVDGTHFWPVGVYVP